MTAEALSVSTYLALLNQTLTILAPDQLLVEGEVADYQVAQQKWITFVLKDEATGERLPCFATVYQHLPPLQNGMRVQLRGQAKVNGKIGRFSLSVTALEIVGEGGLQKAFELLKQQLTVEGLFALERKRPLPEYPEHIGLITSKEAAAYGDFLRILNNRHPGLTVTHVDVHVQGQYAADNIVLAFQMLNALADKERPHVIVLTRGGGSLEELQAFNDERVIRAVFSSAIPVIVGVGHERDETLAEYAADKRASTPSHAAECVISPTTHIRRDIEQMQDLWSSRLATTISIARRSLDHFSFAATEVTLTARAQIERQKSALLTTLEHLLTGHAERLSHAASLLQSYNPTQVLARGYALIRTRTGTTLSSAASATPGDPLSITLRDGMVDALVTGKHLYDQKTTELPRSHERAERNYRLV